MKTTEINTSYKQLVKFTQVESEMSESGMNTACKILKNIKQKEKDVSKVGGWQTHKNIRDSKPWGRRRRTKMKKKKKNIYF